MWLDGGRVWLDVGRVWGHLCMMVEFRGLQVEAIDLIIFWKRKMYIKRYSQPPSSGTGLSASNQVCIG